MSTPDLRDLEALIGTLPADWEARMLLHGRRRGAHAACHIGSGYEFAQHHTIDE